MKQKSRNSTIELLRIASMIMILGLHYLNKSIGGVMNTSSEVNRLIAHTVESFFISSVNVFVLISGYFLIDRKTTGLGKAIELYLVMVIYNLLFFSVAVAAGIFPFSLWELFYVFFPFADGRLWFLETYIIFLLLLPFLNLLLRHLGKRAHALLLGLSLLFFSVWPSFLPSPPILDNGYGIINFIILYLIASYIKKHIVFVSRKKTIICSLACYIISSLAITVSSLCFLRNRAWDYCYLFVISASVSLFVLFLNLPETHNRVINTVSGTTFDVYLTHANLPIRLFIYHTIMQTDRFMDTSWMVPHLVICVILQFSFFSLLGWLRQLMWKPTVRKMLRNSKLLKWESHWEEAIFEGKNR